MTEAEVRPLVAEYVAKSTTKERRVAISQTLRSARPIVSQKSVIAALSDPEKRNLAIELATKLKVPGLTKEAKKYIEGDAEEQVVKLLFSAGDPDALQFLYDRWVKADKSSASFVYIDTGFRAFSIGDLGVLTKFQGLLSSGKSDRADSSAAILAFQLDLEESDAVFVQKSWTTSKAEFARDAKPFTVSGLDSLASDPWETTNARPVGKNLRIKPGGSAILKAVPSTYQKGNFMLRLRVLPTGKGTEVLFGMDWNGEEKCWHAKTTESEWILPTGDGTEKGAPMKSSNWHEIVFTITDRSTEGTPANRRDRRVAISLDGRALMSDGLMNGVLTSITVRSPSSKCVVGGVEFVRK